MNGGEAVGQTEESVVKNDALLRRIVTAGFVVAALFAFSIPAAMAGIDADRSLSGSAMVDSFPDDRSVLPADHSETTMAAVGLVFIGLGLATSTVVHRRRWRNGHGVGR